MCRRRYFIHPTFCLIMLVTGMWISACGTTIIWTNTAGGSWTATTNWSPNQIPGAADTAFITNNGTYTVTLTAYAQVSNLVVGAVSGTQSLTVNGNYTLSATNGTVGANGVLNLNGSILVGMWNIGGTLNCSNGVTINPGSTVTIQAGAVMNLAGNYTAYFYGAVTNAGTINWTGTENLQLYYYGGNTGFIINQAGAFFNVQNDQSMTGGGGNPYLINAGTFQKLAGTNVTTINMLFTNTGVLNVASGTVAFNGSGADSGTITGGGNVSVPGGTLTVANATVPNLLLSGGTLNGASATITNFTWTSGSLQGTNTVMDLASWTGGQLNSASTLTIASNAVMNISGSNYKFLNGILTNSGTVNWTGTGTIELYYYSANTGVIVNQAGALFNVQNDQTITSGGGNPYFINAGTFEKSAGTNTTINVLFTNTGVLNVASGTVAFNQGGTDNGTISGPGNVSVLNGTMTIVGAVPNLILTGGTVNSIGASLANFTWNNGNLQGTNTVTGLANWTGGTMNSGTTLTIASNAVLNLSGSSYKFLNGVLTNAGTVNWTGTGTIELYYYSANTGVIVNQPGALFNIQNDQMITSGGGNPYFLNAGTFLKSAGTNTTINTLFTNIGVLNVASGTVAFNQGGTDSGTISGPGNVSVLNGTLTFAGAVPNLVLAGGTVNGASLIVTNFTWTTGYLQGTNTVTGLASWTSGTINSATTLTIASGAVLNISSSNYKFLNGVLANAGTVNWTGTGNLELYYYSGNAGSIVNQAGALFNVQNDQMIIAGGGNPYFLNAGTFQKSAGTNSTISVLFTNTGTLNLNIYGTGSFSQLNFPGNVPLAGTLNVNFNSYSPTIGDSFALLTYGSETGTFSAVNFPAGLPSWETNTVTYGSTVFTLAIGSIYKLAFTSVPAGTNGAGTVFPPVVVQAEKLDGTPLATNGVAVSMALTSGNGTLSGTLVQNTDPTGKATFNNLSINLIGQKTLTASSPPWLNPVSSLVVITSGTPAQLRLTASPGALQKEGYPFSPAPAVQVLDAFGNIVSNATALITANSISTGTGNLGGVTGMHANGTNGLATFGNLWYNLGNSNQAESVTLYFTSPGLVPATNGPFTVDFVSGLITLTNGNSFVQIDPNSQDGVFSWVVDGSDQLYQHWFWLRQGTNGPQISFDQLGLPLGTSVTPATANLSYLPQGLNVTLFFTLQGGAAGSGTSTLTETISIQNTNNSAANLHLFDYMDFDLAGTNEGDSVSFSTTNSVVQQGKGVTATQTVGGPTPSFWEGSWYAFAFDTINSTNPAVLSDSIIPNLPGDQTFAYQWDVNLGAGQTLTLTLTNNIQGASHGVQVLPGMLSIVRSGANVLLFWPTSGTGSLKLQASASLDGGGAWINVTNPPATVGANYQVTLPPAGGAQFYRLH